MPGLNGTVLVGGGTGFIGSSLCTLLRNNGYGVTLISRMPGLQRISWHELSKSGLPDGVSAVVNLAGQNVLNPKQRWTAGFKQNVWNSRVNTTHTLAQAIIEAKVKPQVFISMSGVGIYEPNDKIEYTENSTNKEFDFLSELCHKWEEAGNLPSDINCRRVIIRSGVVIGRDGGMIKQLYLPFYLGVGGPVGHGNQYLPWIHIDDITRLILYCIEHNVTGVFNGVAPQQVTNKEFSKAFASAMWRPALFPVPTSVLNLIFSEERAKMLTQGQRVVPQRTQAIGFNYLYPNIESACKQVVTN